MGRPLNKKFFGNATGKLLVSAALGDGGGTPENCSIIKQKSNLKYLVQSESATASTALTPGIQYRIVSVGTTTDWSAVGVSGTPTVGQIFTATGTTTGDGTTAEVYICKLTDSTPNAVGEMTIAVTPENAQATAQATVTFTDNAGAIDAITSFDGGYGYWTDGTAVVVAGGGGDGTVDYQVANGSIVAMQLVAGGSGYTGGTQNIADAPATNPPAQLARIINAHLVKTFEGNTYAWPQIAPLGGFRGIFSEADLAEQA